MSTASLSYQNRLKALIDKSVEKDKEMTPQKFKSIYNGLSSNTKKVYDAVPISAIWESAQILKELSRVGVAMTKQTVEANLNILVKNGLICEPEPGNFHREKIKNDGQIVSQKKILKEFKEPQQTERPIDKFSGILETVADLIRVAKILQDEITTVVLEIEVDLEKTEGKNKKLIQLQELLKGLAE